VVTDKSGSAIQAASIQITETDENVSRVVTTNVQGAYQALNLKPGKYRITAKKDGFSILELYHKPSPARWR